MRFAHLILCTALAGLPAMPTVAAEREPLKQGLHRWPALDGKLLLVVGTYQDTVHYRRTYNFFFKLPDNEAWNQVPVLTRKGMAFTWESASGGEVTLADGMVLARKEGAYFVVASKEVRGSYYDKGTITTTWYRLTESSDDQPDDLAYQFKPVFSRNYPDSSQTVEEILAREAALNPKK